MEVGSIYARLGAKFERKGFKDFDAAVKSSASGAQLSERVIRDSHGRITKDVAGLGRVFQDSAGKWKYVAGTMKDGIAVGGRFVKMTSDNVEALKRAGVEIDSTSRRTTGGVRSMFGSVSGLFGHISAGFSSIESRIVSSIGNIMSSLTRLVTYGLAGLAAGLSAWTVKAGIGFEDMRRSAEIGFGALMKSASAGKAFTAELIEFARVTPFASSQIIRIAQRLQAVGFEGSETIPILQAVGDTVARMGLKGEAANESIDRITLALGQMLTSGRVNAQDMRQLTEANIPAWEILAQAIGKTVAETRKLSEEGKISGPAAARTILAAAGQMSAGSMKKVADETVGGLWEQIKDTIRIRAAGALSPLYDALKVQFTRLKNVLSGPGAEGFATRMADTIRTRLVPAITDFVNKVIKNWPRIKAGFFEAANQAKELAQAVIGVAKRINGVVQAVGGWEDAFKLLLAGTLANRAYKFADALMGVTKNIFKTGTAFKTVMMSTIVGAALVAVGYVITHWDKFKGYWQSLLEFLPAAWDATWTIIKGTAQLAAGTITTIILSPILGILDLLSRLPFIGDKFKGALEGLQSFTTDWMREGAETMKEGGKAWWDALNDSFFSKVEGGVKDAKSKVAAVITGGADEAKPKGKDKPKEGLLPAGDLLLGGDNKKSRDWAATRLDELLVKLDIAAGKALETASDKDDLKVKRERAAVVLQIIQILEKRLAATKDKDARRDILERIASLTGERGGLIAELREAGKKEDKDITATPSIDRKIREAQLAIAKAQLTKGTADDEKAKRRLLTATAARINELEKRLRKARGADRDAILEALTSLYNEKASLLEEINNESRQFQMELGSFGAARMALYRDYGGNLRAGVVDAAAGAPAAAAARKAPAKEAPSGGFRDLVVNFGNAPKDAHGFIRQLEVMAPRLAGT